MTLLSDVLLPSIDSVLQRSASEAISDNVPTQAELLSNWVSDYSAFRPRANRTVSHAYEEIMKRYEESSADTTKICRHRIDYESGAMVLIRARKWAEGGDSVSEEDLIECFSGVQSGLEGMKSQASELDRSDLSNTLDDILEMTSELFARISVLSSKYPEDEDSPVKAGGSSSSGEEEMQGGKSNDDLS